MKPNRKKKGCNLEAKEAQGVLLDVPPHPVEVEARETKQCTAQLLFVRDPDSYKEIVEALARNMPIREIKRTWRVGTMTVYAILKREQVKVGTLKEQIAQELFIGGLAGAQRAAELIVDCDDPVQAAMATKMMLETGNLMKGQATSISEHRVIHVDATAAATRLKDRAAQMGLGEAGNFALARDVTGTGAVPVLPPAPEPLSAPAADIESAVIEPATLDLQGIEQPCHTSRHGLQARGDFETGGGGGPARGAASPP